MCGRFVAARPADALAERFAAEPGEVHAHRPSWNVAPTSTAPVVIAGGGPRRVEILRWGLVPTSAASPAGAGRLINARVETAAAKPAFREAVARRRCIVPVDGFFEWKRTPGAPRRPYYFTRPDGDVLALAGVWETWREADGTELRTFAVLTTSAVGPVAQLHSRMPVILETTRWAGWLAPGPLAKGALDDASHGDTALVCWSVSSEVNSARNDGPHLARPAADEPEPLSLFG